LKILKAGNTHLPAIKHISIEFVNKRGPDVDDSTQGLQRQVECVFRKSVMELGIVSGAGPRTLRDSPKSVRPETNPDGGE
jgi:hypothetical protein